MNEDNPNSTELTMKQELAQAELVNNVAYNDKPVVEQPDDVDIFGWANNLVPYVDELKITLYFFNKNYTVYKAKLTGAVNKQLLPLFVEPIVEYILDGIDNGLLVRGFEEAEQEKNVLQKTKIANVENLKTLLNWVHNEQHNIEAFDELEHDLKRIKGVVAHCTHPDMAKSFTVIKNLPTSQIMKGATAWTLKDGVFKPFDTMAALKIPAENQLMVTGDDLFVFSQAKLKQLFGYDAKAALIAERKVDEITANFKLVFEGMNDLQSLVKGKPSTIRKLQNIQPSLVKQDELIAQSDELGIGLLTDDNGAIIIMDDKDLTKFVNLLNDDYVESNMTGLRYEIKSKKILKITEDNLE
jgi:hypothetical protein